MLRLIGDIPNGWAVIRIFLSSSLVVVGMQFLTGDVFTMPTWVVMASIMPENQWGILLVSSGVLGTICRVLGPLARILGGLLVCFLHVTLAVYCLLAASHAVIPHLMLLISVLAFASVLRTAARHAKEAFGHVGT